MRILSALLLSLLTLPAVAAPKVVASIGPIHSLVAGVMEGVAEPKLLIPTGASPHAYALKPSDARALGRADLVIWVGEGLESVLEQPLRSLSGEARVVELLAHEGIERLPGREGGVWRQESESHSDDAHDHEGGYDTHLWLSPGNAKQIARIVAGELSTLDAANAERYQRNAEAVVARIESLSARMREQLQPLQQTPYIVFHDAYHYFESSFGLHPVGAISVSPEQRPGARRIVQIRWAIGERNARCVFSEPQFRPDIVGVVLEGSGARHGVLDPLGAELQPGEGLWFELMQGLADNLSACLAG